MNRTIRLAAIALSFAAAGVVHAESPTVLAPQASTSNISRAAVQAEVLQASAAGLLVIGEAQLQRGDQTAGLRSRADVRAETLAAIASGEVHALSTETNAFGAPYAPARRVTVTTKMALAGR